MTRIGPRLRRLYSGMRGHLKSLLIGTRKVLANFTSVVRRRSFSPRSMAPVNDRARPLWCASPSCDHLRFFRRARTRLPRRFLTAVALSIHPTIRLGFKHRQRSVVGRSDVGHNAGRCSFFANQTATLQTLQMIMSFRMRARSDFVTKGLGMSEPDVSGVVCAGIGEPLTVRFSDSWRANP